MTLFLGIFFSSCAKDGDNEVLPISTKQVILLYLGGDNNLSSETYQKTEAIRKGCQGGFDIKKHSGLTFYISQEQFLFLNSEYKKTKWYNNILTD